MNTKSQSDPLGSWPCLMFWQPIETAPKDGTQILAAVHYPTKGCYGTLLLYWTTILEEYPEGIWVFDFYIPIKYSTPTHWMPVPQYVERSEELKEPPQPGTITLSGPGLSVGKKSIR